MTLRSQVKEKISFFSGQKSGLPPNTLQPSDSQIISNFVLQQGNLQKINGTTLYHVDTNSSGEFLWLERLNDRWIFQRGSLVSFEDSEDAKTFTIIDANYGSNKIFSAKWRDRAYLVNGDRYRSFDGTDIRKVGLLPPEEGVSPRASINISLVAGGSVDDGAHKYVITLFDSVTQTESLPNGSLVGDNGLFNTQEFDAVNNKSGWTPSTLTTGSSDNTVKFNNIGAFTDDIRNVASSRVDRYRIYRTKVGNSVDYFLVTENNIGTLDFSDTIADSALTDLLITDFKTPPPSTRGVTLGSVTTPSVLQDVNIIRVWRDQIFIAGFKNGRYTVNETDKVVKFTIQPSDSILYASDTFLPDYYPFNFEIGSGDDQDITGLAVVGTILSIFKNRSIYIMLGTDPTNQRPKIIDTTKGCVSNSTLQETPFGAICLSDAGFILFTGTSPADIISDDIKDIIKDINYEAIDNAASSYDNIETRYYVMVPTGGSTIPDKTLVYKVDEKAWTVLEGISGSAIKFDKGSDNKERSLIAKKDSGRLLDFSDKQQIKNDGETIFARYASGQIDFGDSSLTKRLSWLQVTIEANILPNLTITILGDYGRGTIFGPTVVIPTATAALYDTAEYDIDRYESDLTGAVIIENVLIPVKGIGNTFSVEIVEKTTLATRHSFRILAVSLLGSLINQPVSK